MSHWLARITDPVAQPVLGTAVMGACYAAAVVVGRLTVPPGAQVSLIWPAAGIAVLWVMRYWSPGVSRPARSLYGALGLLFVLTVAFNAAGGAPLILALGFGVANIVQGLLAAVIYLRPYQQDNLTLDTRRKVLRLLAGSIVGATAGLPFGPLVAWLLGGAQAALFWQWVLRNTASAFVVGCLGLILLQRYRSHRVVGSPRQTLAVFAASVVTYPLVFHVAPSTPMAFLVIPISIWAAAALPLTTVAVHTTLASAATVAFTFYGRGPFSTEVVGTRAALAQAFVLVLGLLTLSLAIDRDERRRLLDQIEASRIASEFQARLLDTIVSTMSEGVVVIQQDGAVVWHNTAASRLLLGQVNPQPEDLEQACRLLHDPTEQTDPPASRAFRGEQVPPTDIVVAHQGVDRVISVQAHPMSYEGALALAIMSDVTENRRRTAELTSFAGVVAHDLLNPIGSIQGWTEILGEELDESAPGLGAEPVKHLSSAARRMRTLVTDLLAYSVTREGQLSLEQVPLQALAQELVDLRVQAGRVNGQVPKHTVEADQTVCADPALVRQLLDNLIGNAVKYAVEGTDPELSISASAPRDGWVAVRVEDRGVGLPPGQEELIFREFHRVEAHRKVYPGTGLGLSICRRIVERHGGRITAGPRLGGGSRFEFTLPAGAPANEDSQRAVDAVAAANRAAARAVVALGAEQDAGSRPR